MKLCECGCGKRTKIAVQTRTNLGHVAGKPIRFINGHRGRGNKARLRHGMSHTPEFAAWHNARDRCFRSTHKQFAYYGGRGIKFLFASFEHFYATLGPRPSPQHSLDRFPNNDGHYEPGNVRWATR